MSAVPSQVGLARFYASSGIYGTVGNQRRVNFSQISLQGLKVAHCNRRRMYTCIRASENITEASRDASNVDEVECVATGLNVECFIPGEEKEIREGRTEVAEIELQPETEESTILQDFLATLLLISPFFFWGTAMVAMKDVLPKAGPLFVASFRLIPAGAVLVAFAASRGRKGPETAMAWLSITVFALVDGACFQGFLAEGLTRTSAGLGSVIIDSQPLTVAVLASLLFGEAIGPLGVLGLLSGVLGLCLLEIPEELWGQWLISAGSYLPFRSLLSEAGGALALIGETAPAPTSEAFDLWDSGEWWMLLSAQSMAVGTVLVRWVCRYNDPLMATGWHMILGGIPLLLLSAQNQDPALSGHLADLSVSDWTALVYTSLFGSAISYGVFFYNANKGNLTRLSSLTFLTPMFAAFFGYIYLGETLTPLQLVGALVTVGAIALVNAKPSSSS
eukprot:TRINITY_DN4331_c0_g1_i2.p1 TRINITY_DN4331_c0_g1~~TRINITY_DN4331_c0_g1_i2.p1  ORF type:complete len:448 (+),score=59.70 TRINITY_DN4331_c0_g1_i2:200-1543(+)